MMIKTSLHRMQRKNHEWNTVHSLNNNAPGILLTVDFEKVFDSIIREYIYDCLKAFGFATGFTDYVKALYNHISIAVINNGKNIPLVLSRKRSATAMSNPTTSFYSGVETWSHSIRNSQIIKRMFINITEIKICQLADDTSCFVADNCFLKNLIRSLCKIRNLLRLSINIEKSKAKSFGSHKPEFNFAYDLDWSEDHVAVFGVTVG